MTEFTTEQAEIVIKENNGNVRDALNVTLARLIAAQEKIIKLETNIRFLQSFIEESE